MQKSIKYIISIMVLLLFTASGLLIYQWFKTPTSTENSTTINDEHISIKEEIYQAIINKDYNVYQDFIDKGENLGIVLEDGKTILEHLVSINDIEYVEKIIDKGFSLKEVDTNHIDVIRNIMASYEPSNPFYDDKVKKLINQIKDELHETDSNGYSLLMDAIYLRNEEISLEIINLIDDVNKVYNNETALTYACKIGFNNQKVIEALIAKNANINFQGENGYTCLMYLIENGIEDILNIFIDLENIELNLINSEGRTILHLCVEYNAINVIDLLLAKADKIDFNIKDNDGYSPKELALYYSERFPNEDLNENGTNDYIELANKL